LLVDDDPISLLLLERSLAAKDCIVRSVRDRRKRRWPCSSASRLQIINRGLVMPEMSGIDLCRWVRARPLQRPCTSSCYGSLGSGAADEALRPRRRLPLQATRRIRTARPPARVGAFRAPFRRPDGRHHEAQRLNDELITANARLEELATQDELTLLPNRRAACGGWKSSGRSRAATISRCLACSSTSITSSNSTTTTVTRPATDVLRQVATAIRSSIRQADAAVSAWRR